MTGSVHDTEVMQNVACPEACQKKKNIQSYGLKRTKSLFSPHQMSGKRGA